jgi:SAM-dependent methyltransferase
MNAIRNIWADSPSYLFRRHCVCTLFKYLKHGKVLEIGVGSGELLRSLAQMGFTGIGLELSYAAIQLARRNLDGYTNKIKVMHTNDAPNNKFDYVIACEVLEHYENDATKLQTWIDQWLKDTGYLILSVPAHKSIWSSGDEWAGHYRRYEQSDLKCLAEKVNLDIQAIYSCGYPISNWLKSIRSLVNYYRLQKQRGKSKFERTIDSGIELGIEKFLMRFCPMKLMEYLVNFQAKFYKMDFGDTYVILAKKKCALEFHTHNESLDNSTRKKK